MNALWQIISFPFRSGPRRPLAARRPDRREMGQEQTTPLGMEATDLSLVQKVNRQNDALERATAARSHGRNNTATTGASLLVPAMPEDETYAARYYSAYIKKDD